MKEKALFFSVFSHFHVVFGNRKSKDVTKQKLGIDKVLVDPQNVQTDCPENASKIFLVHFLSELRFLYDLVKNANKK